MKFRKLITTTVLCVCAFTLSQAQENKTFNYSKSEVESSQVLLSDQWKATVNENVISIFNGNIQNNSDKSLSSLKLELLLSPLETTKKTGILTGYFLNEAQFKNIRKNTTFAGVNVKNGLDITLPPSGEYLPILILTDKKGKVHDFKILEESKIVSKNGVLTLASDQEAETHASATIPPIKDEATFVEKITLNEDNSIVLGKDWKIDIDFKNFMVNLSGGEISNLKANNIKNTQIDVFLTNEDQSVISGDFSGIKIASANLNKNLEGFSKMTDTQISTNLLQIPPQGTYYILLTLSTIDDEGNWSVRNKRIFTDTISL